MKNLLKHLPLLLTICIVGCFLLTGCNQKTTEPKAEKTITDNNITDADATIQETEPYSIDWKETESLATYQWARSISPDLNGLYPDICNTGGDARIQMQTDPDNSLYLLNNSAFLKTDASGQKELMMDYWNEGLVSINGFREGLQYKAMQKTPDGNILLAGEVNLPLLPIKNAFQDQIHGELSGWHYPNDGFITCMNPQGDILWSTYIGGEKSEKINELVVDETGIYLIGHTDSSSFPFTSLHSVPSGNKVALPQEKSVGFILKMDYRGKMLWAYPLLGKSLETSSSNVVSIASNKQNELFLLCTTSYAEFPVYSNTKGMFNKPYTPRKITKESDSTHFDIDHPDDWYILKLDKNGKSMWSTYLGGSGSEFSGSFWGPRYDTPSLLIGEKQIYILGETYSLDYPVTEGMQDGIQMQSLSLEEYWKASEASGCPVITCFTHAGELQWSTYLISPELNITDAFLDKDDLYISGTMINPDRRNSYGYPSKDGYLAQISPRGFLLWSAYLEGEIGDNTLESIWVEKGIVYGAGTTHSPKVTLRDTLSFAPSSGSDQIFGHSLFVLRANPTKAAYSIAMKPLFKEEDPLYCFHILQLSLLKMDHTLYLSGSAISDSYFVYQPIGTREDDYEILPKEAACYFFLTKWETGDNG